MKSSPSDHKEAAAKAASYWLVSLEEDPDDPTLKRQFQSWLNADAENAVAWKNASEVYEMMLLTSPKSTDQWPVEAASGETIARSSFSPQAVTVSQTMRPSRRDSGRHGSARRVVRRAVLGGIAASIAACFMVIFAPSILLHVTADNVTGSGETETVTLSDGSLIYLGPDSAVTINEIAQNHRDVELLRGEAFFVVTPDPNRPFQVHSGDIVTTVLGTSFDVHLGEDNASVGVREGHVAVAGNISNMGIAEELTAGDWIRITKSGEVQRGNMPLDFIAACMDGQIVARDRILSDVVDDLRRHFSGTILLADVDLAKKRVSGVYNTNDPQAALSAIVGAHGGRVTKISPWLLVVSAG